MIAWGAPESPPEQGAGWTVSHRRGGGESAAAGRCIECWSRRIRVSARGLRCSGAREHPKYERPESEREASMPSPSALPVVARRLVLGAALALGLGFASWQDPTVVRAADTPATAPAPNGAPAPDAGDRAAGGKPDVDIRISPHGVEVAPKPGGDASDRRRIDVRGGQVDVQGFGHDRVYDSFEQFMREAPATALFVFLIVTVVFLVPLLAVALLVWYKIRKTRMQHETMLKLAERGIVPPATAMEALASGSSPTATMESLARTGASSAAGSVAGIAPGNVPLYEQARLIRRRTAWSDLRKGVILIAIGVGLSAYSMFDDGTPNGAGLILLFLGIGYCVLWFFQDRPPSSGPHQVPPAPPGGA